MNRLDVIRIGRNLDDKRLTHSNTGNISYKKGDKVVITKTGTNLGKLRLLDFAVCDISLYEIEQQASKELYLHKLIYLYREDVRCVVHAHPIYAIANNGRYLKTTVGVVEEQKPGSVQLATETIRLFRYNKDTNLVLLKNHGIVCVGTSLAECVYIIEEYEQECKLNFLMRNKL